MLIIATPPLIIGDAGEDNAADMRLATSRLIHNLRYHNQHSILPEGNFEKIDEFVPNEDTVLLVTVESAGNYYLRGFVGEEYVGNGWNALSSAKKAEYAVLFSWLHARGFYGQNQYALAMEALGVVGENRELRVNNVGVCTAYLFAPYEIMVSKPDERRIGDENLLAGGLRGESEYVLYVSNGSVANYEYLYQALTAGRRDSDHAVLEYLTSENAYRNFVYENYLAVPTAAQETIERFLGGLELPDGKISFSYAQAIVNAYLSSSNTIYLDEQPAYMGNDLLAYFLEESREGNSIHYATAASLMFRYLGIPARYVEGYRMIHGETDSPNTGDTVSISGKDACAWVEIYRDGIGFVPFEPTLPDITPPDTSIPSQNNDIPPEEPLRLNNPGDFAWWTLSAIILLLLLSFLLLVIRRAIKRQRLRAFFEVADNARAVSRMTTYLIQSLRYMGIHQENGSLYLLQTALEKKMGAKAGEEYAAVINVQQQAIFSRHQIDDEDRALVNRFIKSTLEYLKKQSSLRERIRLKWIKCIL